MPVIGPPIEAEQAEVLHQEDVGGHLRHLAGGKPDGQDAPADGGRAQGRPERFAPDRVIDHITAAPVGGSTHRFAQIRLFRVDADIGTFRAGRLQALAAACAGDHACAEELADLDSRQSDASGGPQNQQGLSVGEICAVPEGEIGGAVGDLQGGGLRIGHGIRNRNAGDGLRTGLLRKSAMPAHRGHAGPDRRCADVFAMLHDHAGDFETGDERIAGLFLVFVVDHQKIGEIDSACGDLQPHLTGARLRRGNRVATQGAPGLWVRMASMGGGPFGAGICRRA